jgi:hypothetical protein
MRLANHDVVLAARVRIIVGCKNIPSVNDTQNYPAITVQEIAAAR